MTYAFHRTVVCMSLIQVCVASLVTHRNDFAAMFQASFAAYNLVSRFLRLDSVKWHNIIYIASIQCEGESGEFAI